MLYLRSRGPLIGRQSATHGWLLQRTSRLMRLGWLLHGDAETNYGNSYDYNKDRNSPSASSKIWRLRSKCPNNHFHSFSSQIPDIKTCSLAKSARESFSEHQEYYLSHHARRQQIKKELQHNRLNLVRLITNHRFPEPGISIPISTVGMEEYHTTVRIEWSEG